MCSCNEEYYIPLIRKEERARPWRTPYPLFIEDVPRRNRAAAGEHGAVRARLLLLAVVLDGERSGGNFPLNPPTLKTIPKELIRHAGDL